MFVCSFFCFAPFLLLLLGTYCVQHNLVVLVELFCFAYDSQLNHDESVSIRISFVINATTTFCSYLC